MLAVADLERKDVNLDLIKVLPFCHWYNDGFHLFSVAKRKQHSFSHAEQHKLMCVFKSQH